MYEAAIGFVWIASFLLKDRIREYDSAFNQHFMMLSFGFLVGALAFRNSNAFRVAYYYIFVVLIIIPDLVKSVDSHGSLLARMVLVVMCVAFLSVTTPSIMGTTLNPSGAYSTFWMQYENIVF